MDPKLYRLDREAIALATKTSEFEFDVVHCTRIEHQAVEPLLRVGTTGTDEKPNEDDIPVLCISSSNHPKKKW